VIAIGAADDHEAVRAMLSAGARGHLPRHAGTHELLRSVRQSAAHAAPVADRVTHTIVADINTELQSRLSRDRRRDRTRERILRVIHAGGPQVVVQPIRRLVSSEVVGFEALSRFGNEGLTTAEWFEDAHSCGLGAELEIAALRGAVQHAWPLIAGRGDAYLAINVSPSTLGYPEAIHLLGQLPADRVVVELTEHELITDSHHLGALSRIRSAGMRLAVDDVGAGFAGLQRLLTLRPEIIKLDRSIVSTIETDPSRRALTRALAGFADELGIALVAEGIERWSQTLSLCELGVSIGQGYLLGPPEGTVSGPAGSDQRSRRLRPIASEPA
jgi:EAL domain-containing protein (putative c-di-GMP-specific phosphodiesterase class I)